MITNALALGGDAPLHLGALKPATIPNRARSGVQFLPVGRSTIIPFNNKQKLRHFRQYSFLLPYHACTQATLPLFITFPTALQFGFSTNETLTDTSLPITISYNICPQPVRRLSSKCSIDLVFLHLPTQLHTHTQLNVHLHTILAYFKMLALLTA